MMRGLVLLLKPGLKAFHWGPIYWILARGFGGFYLSNRKEAVKEVPLPTWLFTSISPPMDSTCVFVIYKPTPLESSCWWKV